MSFDVKTIAVYLPVAAAILFGLSYALFGRLMQTINVQTYCVASMLFGILGGLIAYVFFSDKINLAPLMHTSAGWLLLAALSAALLAWICTLLAMSSISATYAAVGELSYPLFTALFAYLLFHARELDWKMAIGGALIAAGSLIVVTDKIKIGG